MNLADLKNEILNDPAGIGYVGMTDAQVAELMNTNKREVPNDEELRTWKLFSKLERGEYRQVLADPVKSQILTHLLSMGLFNPSDTNVIEAIKFVFGAGSNTVSALQSLGKRNGTRAEELGLGAVTPSDVAGARRLP